MAEKSERAVVERPSGRRVRASFLSCNLLCEWCSRAGDTVVAAGDQTLLANGVWSMDCANCAFCAFEGDLRGGVLLIEVHNYRRFRRTDPPVSRGLVVFRNNYQLFVVKGENDGGKRLSV